MGMVPETYVAKKGESLKKVSVAQPIKVTTWANKAMILIACHSKGWVSI